MGFYAYLLRCADGSYYTGHSDDMERRFGQHVAGQGGTYTAKRRPVELVWAESFPPREEALSAELRVKKWSRAKKEALIAADWRALSIAAMPPKEREARTGALRPSTSLGANGGG